MKRLPKTLLFAPAFALFCPLPAQSEPNPTPLRVLCWNIHHGVGTDGKLDLNRIAALILREEPDLVALQEVDHTCHRSGSVDQTAELAKLTGMHGLFGRAMDFQGGQYGQAILSKFPITSSSVHPLPSTAEPRILFQATVSNTTEIRIATIHLGLTAEERLPQAKQAAAILARENIPTILCGDFNAEPGSEVLKIFEDQWNTPKKPENPFTHPASEPRVEIDHFFTRGFVGTIESRVIDELVASDHRPLLLTISPTKRESSGSK